MDKNIPLSELIRLGARIRGQCFGSTINAFGETCAIGAAYMGKFGEEPPHSTDACARALGIAPALANAIELKNDDFRWSREQIADWLERCGVES